MTRAAEILWVATLIGVFATTTALIKHRPLDAIPLALTALTCAVLSLGAILTGRHRP